MCQMSKDVKLSKDVKYSNIWTMQEGRKKNDIMRFTDIGINFYIRYEGHQNCPKYFLRVFGDHLVSHQN